MKYKGKRIEVIGSKILFGKETLWIHILEDDSFAQVLRSDLEEDMPETKQSQKRNSVHLVLQNSALHVLVSNISERPKCVDCRQRKKNGQIHLQEGAVWYRMSNSF